MKHNCKLLTLIVSCILLTSFQNSYAQSLVGKWQAVNILAPTQDSMMHAQIKVQLQQIDELNEVDSGMVARFNTTDLATIKKLAKEEASKQPEQMKQQMKEAAADFSFELMKDGNAIILSRGAADTVRWYFGDNNKKLFLDHFEVKNDNPEENKSVMIFDIIHSDADNMRLRVHQAIGNDVFVDLVRSGIKKKK